MQRLGGEFGALFTKRNWVSKRSKLGIFCPENTHILALATLRTQLGIHLCNCIFAKFAKYNLYCV